MPVCRLFPCASHSAATVPFRARTHTGGLRCPLHVVVALITMGAAFGIARAQGTWSTAQLSVARAGIAATSVQTSTGGNVAIFAGGEIATGSLLHREGGRVARLRIYRCI